MVKRIIRSELFPIAILIIFGIITGIMFFQDFGVSWDEPDLYTYADQSFQAYSISNWLNGQNNLDSFLGPNDLRLYGPAYLIIGKLGLEIIRTFFPALSEIDIWHLLNYFMFIFGIVIFYKLIIRWIKPLTAFVATLLFASQPVLFGLSWIDPKDIPFMVLFTTSIYFGLKFSDFLGPLFAYPVGIMKIKEERYVPGKKFLRMFITISLTIFASSVFIYIFSNEIVQYLSQTISGIDTLPNNNIFKQLFYAVAKNARFIPLSLYVGKITKLFFSFRTILAIFAGAFGILSFSLVISPKWVQYFYFRFIDFVYSLSYGLKHTKRKSNVICYLLLASFFLGTTTSTRILGPLAGLLVSGVILSKLKWKGIPILIVYGMLSIIVTFAAWPYLWQNTLQRFSDVFLHMSDNPVGVGVLFQGQSFNSRDLPSYYLPILLSITLTIPVLILALGGFTLKIIHIIKQKKLAEDFILVAWFLIPFFYVILFRPAMYDNYRHFMFILPPLFYLCGVALQELFKFHWIAFRGVVILLSLAPGVVGIANIHPYEYSYYNSLVGGLSGAAGNYEVDYWLTCYKELTLQINEKEKTTNNLFVAFLPNLVKYYSDPRFSLYKANDSNYPVDSLLILPIRRESTIQFPEFPVEYKVEREKVQICVGKRVK